MDHTESIISPDEEYTYDNSTEGFINIHGHGEGIGTHDSKVRGM